MLSKGHFTRIDLAKLKATIYQKIGHERANLYFNLLTQYINSKISKGEFTRLCLRTIGKENRSLHDHFIRSILNNASLSKVSPPQVTNANGPLNARLVNRYQTKRRSRFSRPSKFRDRVSPLGPLGKTSSPALDQSPTELNSRGSRLHVVSVEDGEEVEQITAKSRVQSRSPISAPLGVSLNFGCGSRKESIFKDTAYDSNSVRCQSSGELPDAMSLRGRLERRLSDGVGISEDCVNLLNNGLNLFLKRLIEPGMGLVRSRSGFCISMLDFCVSMESNPRVLGEDWPIQLEKVCSRAYEE